MTNSTQITRPVVKATNPELYKEHTFHLSRASKYTYNYAQLDDYIAMHWKSKTIQQMAEDTNELTNRVVYRYQLLQRMGVIGHKQTGKTKLLVEQRKLRMQLLVVEDRLRDIAAA